MEFKIDTKEKIEIITPQFNLFNNNMADELCKKTISIAQSGKSVIIDFSNIESLEPFVIPILEENYHQLYNMQVSCAFCSLKKEIANQFSDIQNIVPTLVEAVDIVSMEGLERELFADE